MSLEPSGHGPPSRRSRERRAFRLVVTGGTAAVVAAVTFVLAIAGAMGFGIPVIAAIVAAICWVLFRRTVGLR
jgi:putative flippase GtrA